MSRAIGSDQVLPILQSILIHAEGKRCTLSGTNLEVSMVTSFEVTIENEGSITIPAKAILNFMQYNQDEEVVLETSEGTQLKLHSRSAKALIAGETASAFPVITAIQKETTLSLPIPPLLRALSLVTFTCAKTTSRPVISGVFVRLEKGTLIFVGTDSYRLSEYKIRVEGLSGEISCIIPARFLEELKSVIALHYSHSEEEQETEMKSKRRTSSQIERAVRGPALDAESLAPRRDRGEVLSSSLSLRAEGRPEGVDVHLSSQQIEVHVGPTRLTSRLIDGKFPDYIQVLPKEKHTTALISVKDLLGAVKRMHYFAKEQSNNITFSFTRSGAHLATKQTQLGKDESTIPIELEGKENRIAISSTYLIDFLSRMSSDEKVSVELLDKMHPAVFRLASQEPFLHLIMPLRMSEE